MGMAQFPSTMSLFELTIFIKESGRMFFIYVTKNTFSKADATLFASVLVKLNLSKVTQYVKACLVVLDSRYIVQFGFSSSFIE
jgi:hypothetical protein